MNGIFFCSLAAITWPYGKLLMRICDLVFMAHEWSKSKFSVIPILALGYCYYVTNIKIQNKLQKREERKGEKDWGRTKENLDLCVFQQKFQRKPTLQLIFGFMQYVLVLSVSVPELQSNWFQFYYIWRPFQQIRWTTTVCQIRCICTFFIKLSTLFRNYKMNEILIASTP